MERLTHERVNGIKTGYWSPAKKEDLVQRLAAYEDTGLTPEEIMDGKMLTGWIPVAERLPAENTRVLVTIKHHRWIADYESERVPDSEKTLHEEYTEVCEAIYHFGDFGWEYICMETGAIERAFISPAIDISNPVDEVIAWMPLPEPYRPEMLREAGADAGQYADNPTLQSAT